MWTAMTLLFLALLDLPASITTKETPMMDIVWEVNEAAFLREKNGGRIYSPEFTTYNGSNEQLWNSLLYPDGFEVCDKTFIGIYLCYYGFNEVKVKYQFYMLNNVSNNFGHGLETNVFSYGTCEGHRRFLSRESLMKDGYLFDGKVMIGLQIQSGPATLRETKKNLVLKEFIWNVKSKDFQKKLSGEIIESSQFRTYNRSVEQQWTLMVLPRGTTSENQEFVSIYLCYSGKRSIRTFIEIYLLNHLSDKHTHGFVWEIFEGNQHRECKGLDRFIARNRVLKSTNGFLFSDNIKVGVRLLTDSPVEQVSKESSRAPKFAATLSELITTYTLTNTTTVTNRTMMLDRL